jgi:roadblock/LC7 domain-containing protein
MTELWIEEAGGTTPPPGEDPLAEVPGVVASVLVWEDGRARRLVGLDASLASESGHFVASVNMVLDTLVQIWNDIVELEVAPLRAWVLRSGRYWIVGSARGGWVLDPEEADLPTVLRLVDQFS